MNDLAKKAKRFNERATKGVSALREEFEAYIKSQIEGGANSYRFKNSIYTCVDGRECEVYGIYFEDGKAVLDMFAPDYITLDMLHYTEAIELISKFFGVKF